MLNLMIGTDWTANRKAIFDKLAADVVSCRGNRILLVPELISHDMERRLCKEAGDCASLYAEVLSFTRLSRRVSDAAGHSAIPCLDEGGRVVAMASAVNQVRSIVKFFASVETKLEFIAGLVETVDECKRCAVGPADLMQASKETTGVLAQKLEELSVIFEAYDSLCAHGKKDPRDQLTWLLDELETGTFAQDHTFYIDGFYDFTRQQTDILGHLIEYSPDVTVSLCCDRPDSTALAFERPGETAAQLIRLARSKGIAVNIISVDGKVGAIDSVCKVLFEGELSATQMDCLQLLCCDSVYRECEAVAEQILELVRNGNRFRDIAVVCPNMAEYDGPLQMVLERCGIPAYLSGNQNILDRPVIATVLAAIDAALSGFDQKDILYYLKTALSPVDLDECDIIENYALLWNISGKRWTQAWSMHPKGLVEEWTDTDRTELSRLNSIRERIMKPFVLLREALFSAKTAADQARALYNFLEDIHLAQQLKNLSERLQIAGDLQNAQVLSQLWEILVNGLEQMHDVLGSTAWEPEAFSRFFRILLSRYDVGTIPTVLDSVTVGTVNAMHCHEQKHLFVLGAVEGALPGYGTSSGVLTDQDRSALRDLGVPLNGGAVDSLQTTFSEIYSVFRGAGCSICVSYPGGQPSYVYQRLTNLSVESVPGNDTLGAAACNKKQSAAYLLRANDREAAKTLGIENIYEELGQKRAHIHGTVSADHIEKLYGKQFKLSASQIDLYANCAMSYFLKYGLRVKERKAAEVDPAEFGTFVHDVLEKTAREIMQQGGFKTVTKESALQIAASYAKDYISRHFADLESQRMTYLLNRNGRELSLIVEELWEELHSSMFEPKMFELSFGGDNGDYPPIHIQGNTVSAKLRGYVDRVDIWKNDDTSYFRVVDYKTGVKSFDYCDVINGIGLQMLLYLFALAQADSALLGDSPVAAGVQYFPARAPVISVDNGGDEQEAQKERELCWKRSGLILAEETVLQAMEPDEEHQRMPFKRKKDGSVTGDLADRHQFAMLSQFIHRYLTTMVDDIASGNVTANPYTRDARKNACRFCPYGEVCHKADVEGRRVFKAINAQRFWEDISREVRGHG